MTDIRFPDGHSTNIDKFLKQIGINILTGESCGIGMRLLCDLNDEGVDLYTAFTGGASPQQSNWNRMVNFHNKAGDYESTPAVKSVLLTRDAFRNLVIFKLAQSYKVVDSIFGRHTTGDFYIDNIKCFNDIESARAESFKYQDVYDDKGVKFRRFYNTSTSNARDLRNTHVMSGRVNV